MAEHIGIFVAWPYANGPLHLGHVAGAYLPPDIFARYHRLRGSQVLMVSGSDTHGTPITVRAEQEGTAPIEIVERYHADFLNSFTRLGISFDLFTYTETENHYRVAQQVFMRLFERGYVYREAMPALYCEFDRRFLPDRYVEGTCPHCGYERARGDQCNRCARPLDALELINPRCKFCGQTPVVRETEHFFLDLAKLNAALTEWVEQQAHWRPNVIKFTLNLLRERLRGRPITRDIDWGIPLPIDGYPDKRIYVWFEAVIGYLSASIEWAVNRGQPQRWREWWQRPARGYYFIGKDNIPFHTIIWPAMLMGCSGLNLPYDVPANEHLTLEGQPMSTSLNWALWLPDYLSRYDPDPLRYYLSINGPEARDADFSWADFVRRNNDELVATWGNLAHRALTFAYRHFDGKVPGPGELRPADRELLDKVEASFGPIGDLLAGCKFKAAITEAMALAREANRYLDAQAPWLHIKEDRAGAATSLYVALRVIDSLKTLLCPFLPFSSQQLHESLSYEGDLLGGFRIETFHEANRSHAALVYDPPSGGATWSPSALRPGQRLREPRPLFKKLDDKIAEEELARLKQAASG